MTEIEYINLTILLYDILAYDYHGQFQMLAYMLM